MRPADPEAAGVTSIAAQKICLWCMPVFLVLFTIGFVGLAGFLPPPSPSDTPQQVADLYAGNRDGIRAGLALCIIAGGLSAPFVAVITIQMRRIEGDASPFAFTQLGTGMVGVLLFSGPMLLLELPAFRENRDLQTLQALHDLGWIGLIGPFFCVYVQCLAVGVCILRDPGERVWPRWVGYFNIWVAVCFFPGALLYFFKSGPFAWNGIFVWWIPLTVFFGWFVVMFVTTMQALNRQDRELSGAPA